MGRAHVKQDTQVTHVTVLSAWTRVARATVASVMTWATASAVVVSAIKFIPETRARMRWYVRTFYTFSSNQML